MELEWSDTTVYFIDLMMKKRFSIHERLKVDIVESQFPSLGR